jgi:hypothetical protein
MCDSERSNLPGTADLRKAAQTGLPLGKGELHVCPALLEADAANGGKENRRNLAGFAEVAKPIAVDRLTKGCSRIAGLWFSAWNEAGKPFLSDLSSDTEDDNIGLASRS